MIPGASGTTPGPTPEILEAAENKLAIGRTIIRKRAPYLAPTIYGFIPHVMVGLNTLGVTKGMVLYYDPVWLAGCKDHEVAAALVHESQHHVRDHLQRSESMINKEIANIALDEAINPHLREAGWELPHGVFPEDFGHPPDLTAEEYYALHMQAAQQQPQPSPKAGRAGQSRPGTGQPGPGSSGQGPPPPKSDGPPGDPGGEGQGGGEESPGDGEKSPGCGSGRCGGIAGNPLRELEDALDEVEKLAILSEDLLVLARVQRGRAEAGSWLIDAIGDAIGVSLTRIPATPEVVMDGLDAMRQQQQQQQQQQRSAEA